MGGCRCTYRNCTVKSDGITHFFHYPVFDKIRCHQWLVNAQKLDFLELKVSQLKNRVVCQHHFTDDNFMNYKKDKLTFEAIPMEDGPFCDSKKLDIKPFTSYPSLVLLEDIENDVIINDKKANYSIKYGDFLTNGELMETLKFNKINKTIDNVIEDTKSNIDLNCDSQVAIFTPCLNKMPVNNVNKSQPQPMLIVPPYTELSNELKAGNQINQEFGIVNVVQSNQNYDNIPIYIQGNNQPNIPISSNEVAIKKEPKIKILSEKKIRLHTPLPIGELRKVSPSTTLNFCKTLNNTIKVEEPLNDSETEMLANKPSDRLKVLEILNVGFENTLKENGTQNTLVITEQIKAEEPVEFQTSPRSPKVKNKITPERSAVIEQKRKFNMKMKDVLESCLNKLDEPVKQNKQKNKTPLTKFPTKTVLINKNELRTKLQDKSNEIESNISNIQEYTLAYLDARMKKMENTLLNKIEQNSHSISEIKDSFENVKKEQKKLKHAHTSTDEVCYKKYLFKEISKYLSQNLSNTIYEEMFNKNSLDNQMSPRKKRRKYI